MEPKALKKLADACRKAGIKSFKNAEVEFTLTDEIPLSTYKARANKPKIHANADKPYESDTLTPEQLLFYSAHGMDPSDEATN